MAVTPKVYRSGTENVSCVMGDISKIYGGNSRGVQTPSLFGAGIMPARKFARHDLSQVKPKSPISPYFTTPLGVGMVSTKSAKNRHITQDATPRNAHGGVLALADGRAERPG